MRKLTAISLLLCAALLSGCGSAPKKQNSAAETQAPTQAETAAPETDAPTEEPTTEPAVDENATPLTSFSYEIREDGTAAITDFTGKETEVVVPSFIGDAPVTEIGHYAFEAAWNVTSIVLPESITTIGEQAFLDCESLTSVNIPEGVTALHRAVFAGCLALPSITIPASVASTDEEMFVACYALTDLYILNPELDYASWGLEELEAPCTIHAPEGAVILTWAEANGFPVETMTE